MTTVRHVDTTGESIIYVSLNFQGGTLSVNAVVIFLGEISVERGNLFVVETSILYIHFAF